MGIINKQNASEQIVDYILNEINENRLKSGDKLMNERDFSEKLGVSRVPLREAIRSLCIIGILKTRQGEGTFVNTYDPEILGRTIYTYTILEDTPYMEIMEMRKIMESEAAKLACKYATEEDLEAIRITLESSKYNEEQNNHGDFRNHDQLFHFAVATATHNSFFKKFLDSIRLSIHRKHIKDLSDKEIFVAAATIHNQIYEAIRNRDEMLAYRLMNDHIEAVNHEIVKKMPSL